MHNPSMVIVECLEFICIHGGVQGLSFGERNLDKLDSSIASSETAGQKKAKPPRGL